MAWIIFPEDERCSQEVYAGGKGASLARLLRHGLLVPQFFVIPVAAHRSFHREDESPEFIEELRAALARLGDGPAAVRSSAIGEDAAESSFAGLYHTSLQVKGLEAVLAAVRECWSSYDNPAAASYRERNPTHEGGMAVVVQKMVQAEWGGVCFTADPVAKTLSAGVINAVPGLGEALVSGAVNPEEIVIRVSDGTIERRRRGEADAPLPEGVTKAVWEASLCIAEAEAFPQDVEWASRGGEVFILQSRPITTIADVFYSRFIEPWRDDPRADPDNPDRIWTRAYADEIWTPPTSPLFYNIQNLTGSFASYWAWHHDSGALPPDVFKYHQASPYLDVLVLHRMYEYHPRFSRISGILNFFPEAMQQGVERAPFRWYGRLRRTLHFELRQRKLRSLGNNHKTLAAQWPPFVMTTDRWFDTPLDDLSLDQLRAHQSEVYAEMGRVGPACGFAVAYHAHDLTFILTGLLQRWCGDGDMLYAKVTSGLDGSATVREAEGVWRLAQRLREMGSEATALAELSGWEPFRSQITAHAGGAEFVAAFERFWHDHRHRGGSYKDLVYPRWGDDPDHLFGVIKGYLGSTAKNPAEENRQQAAERQLAQRAILRGLKGPLAPPRRAILRWLFRYNEIYMAERDNHRYYFDRVWYELRRIYLAYGGHLCAAGVLEQPGHVFFLGISEVEAALNGALLANEVRRRVGARRAQWERTLRIQAPKFLKGYAPHGAVPVGADGLRGIGASPGVVTGTARVIYDISELASVRDGEILVTRQTDPGWTTVFARIGGLVLETGGVLAHGTSLCREYGLPCVTAVERATARIPEGATIEIDGASGAIRIAG